MGEVSNLIFVNPSIAKKLAKELAEWEEEALANAVSAEDIKN